MSNHKRPTALYTPAEGWERYIDEAFSKDKHVRPFHAITKGLPLVFKEIGVSEKDIVFSYKTWAVNHILDEGNLLHPEATKEMFKTIPKQLADPIAIFDSDSPHAKKFGITGLTVFTDIPVGDDLVLIAVHLDKKHGKNNNFHRVASAYKRAETLKTIKRWMDCGFTRYIDEKRISEMLSTIIGKSESREGVQFPQWAKLTNSSTHNIVLKSELVKKYPEAFGICPEESLTPQVEKSPIPKHNQVQKAPIPNIDFSTSKRQQKMLGIKR